MSAFRRADGLRGTRRLLGSASTLVAPLGSRGFRILGVAPRHCPFMAFPMHVRFTNIRTRFTLEGRRMKKLGVRIVGCFTVALAFAALAAAPALAQSSGNFTYGSNGGSTHCVLETNGNITGGQTCQENCTLQPDGTVACTGDGQGSGLCVGGFGVGIKTNS